MKVVKSVCIDESHLSIKIVRFPKSASTTECGNSADNVRDRKSVRMIVEKRTASIVMVLRGVVIDVDEASVVTAKKSRSQNVGNNTCITFN